MGCYKTNSFVAVIVHLITACKWYSTYLVLRAVREDDNLCSVAYIYPSPDTVWKNHNSMSMSARGSVIFQLQLVAEPEFHFTNQGT